MMKSAGSFFNRLARIHELGLAQNLASRQFGRTSQSDQRRISNCRDNILLDLHSGK